MTLKKKINLPIGCSKVCGAGIDSMEINPDGTKPIAQYITPSTFKKAISRCTALHYVTVKV
jgi:hypothetical protein